MAGWWLDVWRAVAEDLRGELTHDDTTWSSQLEVSIDGLAVRASAYKAADSVAMRIRAPAPGAEIIDLTVHHGYIYPIGRALGFQDVNVGDLLFDDRFIVKCNDDELARAWLDADSRAGISAASDAYAFNVRDGDVVVTRSGVLPEDDPRSFEVALRGTVKLARAGERMLARWQAAAAQLGGKLITRHGVWGVDGEVQLELMHPNARIQIDVAYEGLAGRGAPALWTRARTRRTAAVQDRWAVHARERKFRASPRLAEGEPIADGGFADRWRCLADDFGRLALRLTPARRLLFRDLGPAAVTGDPGEVSGWLPGFVHDPARLARLADLVAELAIEIDPVSGGPYR